MIEFWCVLPAPPRRFVEACAAAGAVPPLLGFDLLAAGRAKARAATAAGPAAAQGSTDLADLPVCRRPAEALPRLETAVLGG